METVDIVLICIYLVMAATIGVLLFSVVRGVCLREKSFTTVNGIPVGRIAAATATGTSAILAVTFLTASEQPLTVNGGQYTEWIWLKTADMFIFTSLLMIAAASAVVVFGIIRRYGNVYKK